MRFILPGTPDDLQLETVHRVDGQDHGPGEEANSMKSAPSISIRRRSPPLLNTSAGWDWILPWETG